MVHDRLSNMLPGVIALVALVILIIPAMAWGDYTWGPGDPNYFTDEMISDCTIAQCYDYSVNLADYIGTAQNTFTNGFGSSGQIVGWDDTYVNGQGNADTNGDAWDGLWVAPDIAVGQRGWWDLKDEYSEIVVSTSQDGGPYLAKGLGYHIVGCSRAFDDASCNDFDAVLEVVALEGWRPFAPDEDQNGNGWCSDDISAFFYLGSTSRYVRVEGWSASGGLNAPKIDAIGGTTGPQPIPEFPGDTVPVALLTGMFLAVIWLRKGR